MTDGLQMSSEIERYGRYVATLRPLRTDDLQPGVAEFIGWRGVWQAAWIIEDGPYRGQWAMAPHYDNPPPLPPFAWAPQCDLTDIEAGD